jgi:hypothetical protein
VYIAPVLWVVGRVRQTQPRTVDTVPAREAKHDEQGNLLQTALPERPGYSVTDLVLDTDPGGLVSVVSRDDRNVEHGYTLPAVGTGEEVRLPVRTFVNWVGRPGRKTPVVGFALASEIAAAAQKTPQLAAARSAS